ncbi:MAG: aminotransferase class V-fold PLP-dependent enzyme [Ignavibacteriales bacterium]|nr:aminotransferase class V-fold PLP-dependent enzyme [Ignavibacteriales bacterium]MBI3786999.1 aminotransferase class V-fold PLP-dependent enzyme [Ignavibacteriales bacterium]
MKRKDFFKTIAAASAGVALFPKLSQAEKAARQSLDVWPVVDASDEQFWTFVRSQFPLTDERAYFNTGGLGASPYAVIDAVKAKIDELEKVSETGHSEQLWKEIKTPMAQLLGCDIEELALMRNTTEGINVVANGLPLKQGDEIITTTHEHVGNGMTWVWLQKRTGVMLKFFEPSTTSAQENIDRIAALITKKTRLISIPHATTTTGQILPIKEISKLAKDKNIWLFVDGAQTAGMIPFNLHDMGCDAYATSGHKWLLGPKETGLLYVRKDMLDIIEAKHIGAYSDSGVYDLVKNELKLHPSAQRYEYGTVSIPLRVGFGAAVKFIQHIGIENVWKRDQALSTYLFKKLREIPNIKVLSPASDTERSAMISFQHEKLPFLELQTHLNAYKLRTRGVSEGGVNALRISTHIYNNFEEIDRLLEGVKTAKK